MTTATIIGIDPGSTNLGLGLITFDLCTGIIQSTDAYTIRADRSDYYKSVLDYHSDKTRRLLVIEEMLLEAFNQYQPLLVASESPFYNRFRPNAYGVLVETICSIRNALMKYNDRLSLISVYPPSVKKAVGTTKLVGKDPVRDSITLLTELHIQTPLKELDEHAVDAIAVAYSAYKQYLGGTL